MIFGISLWQALLLVLGVAGVVSFGIIHVLKMGYAAYLESTPEDDRAPWFWNTEIRILAIIIGTAVGALSSYAGVPIFLALGVGFAGGLMNTLIVKKIKDKLKSMKIGEDDSEGGEESK